MGADGQGEERWDGIAHLRVLGDFNLTPEGACRFAPVEDKAIWKPLEPGHLSHGQGSGGRIVDEIIGKGHHRRTWPIGTKHLLRVLEASKADERASKQFGIAADFSSRIVMHGVVVEAQERKPDPGHPLARRGPRCLGILLQIDIWKPEYVAVGVLFGERLMNPETRRNLRRMTPQIMVRRR